VTLPQRRGMALACVWLRATILVACAVGTAAQGQTAADSVSAKGRSAAQWLQAIQQAALRQTYQGVVVYQRDTDVRSSRVMHLFDGVQSHERVQPFDGQRREYLRSGDETQCLYPEIGRAHV